MGCLESRPELSYEEAAMVNGEYELIYTEHNFERYFSKLKQLAQNGFVSKQHFHAYAAELSLQHQDAKVIKLYEKFLNDEKYDLKFLVSLAAILSRGSIKSKVEGIFEVYMVASAKVVGKPKFTNFIELIFDLSSVELLKLAQAPNSTNNYKQEDFDSYVSLMQNGKEESKKEIIESLFANKRSSVTLEQLLEWAEKEENHQWFSSITIRKALKHKAKRVLHEQKKQSKPKESEPAHHESEKKASVEVNVGGFKAEASVESHHSHHSHHREHHEENKE